MTTFIYEIPRPAMKEREYGQICRAKDKNISKNDTLNKKLAAVLLQLHHKNNF